MQLIETYTVPAGGVSSISLTSLGSIPGDYTDLCLKASLRSGRGETLDVVALRFNNQTSTNTDCRQMIGFGSGSGYTEGRGGATTYIPSYGATGNSALANTFGNANFYIPNYATNRQKTVSIDWIFQNNTTSVWAGTTAGYWSDSSPITSIQLFPVFGGTWLENSKVSLYGITAGSDGTTTVS